MQVQSRFDFDEISKQLVVLGYFIRMLYSQENNDDYFNMLRLKIIPLIRLIAPNKVDKWVKEKRDYIWQCNRLERRVIEEVSVIFEVLQQRLEKEKLLDARGVGEACIALESILKFEPEGKKVWVMPAQYAIAFECLKNLCDAIVRSGRKDLIEDYLGECDWDLNIYWDSDIHFNEKFFVSSYFELAKINKIFSNSASGVWDKLWSIEWGWSVDRRDYFRKKRLHYNNAQEAIRSRKLLNANGYWYEVKAVKKGRRSILCTRENFAWYVHLVISAIDTKCVGVVADDVICLPEAIKLSLENDGELRLIVQWTEGCCEIKHLHTFHYSDPDDYSNVRYDFLKNMLQRPGEIITIDPVSGAKATKYLRDIGLYGVLDTLFVANKKGDKAALITDQINLKDRSETVMCDLRKHLESLETCGWRKKIIEQN